MTNPFNAKTATLSLELDAASGYHSSETHRISPSQWGRIVTILNEPEVASEPQEYAEGEMD